MAATLRTRVLGRRLRLEPVEGWVQKEETDPEDGFSLVTIGRRLPVRIRGNTFRGGQRLVLVAAYRGRGRRRAWALWREPGSGRQEWIRRPRELARRLGLPWRLGTLVDVGAAAFLVWAVAVRSLRFPAFYEEAAGVLGDRTVRILLDPVFGFFHALDRLLVRLEWMRAYDRVFDYPLWLAAGVILTYIAIKTVLVGLSREYATFRLRRSVERAAR